jgi:hypothetical protein
MFRGGQFLDLGSEVEYTKFNSLFHAYLCKVYLCVVFFNANGSGILLLCWDHGKGY